MNKAEQWTPAPHPDWLTTVNREGGSFDLPAVVPLDEQSLLYQASQSTGLSDYGMRAGTSPFAYC